MRIAQQAFALADQRRRRVTAVHKANVMRMTVAYSGMLTRGRCRLSRC